MSKEYCYGFICFIPLDASSPKFFGFSEFIAGLALMILAWTIADVRYRFRIATAPLPLEKIAFSIVSMIGILTLLTDLWRAEEWLVPQGNLLTPSGWQAILGGLFLLTFLIWSWFAFIYPAVYGKWNSKRYMQALGRAILKGSHSDLSIIADELTSSIKSIISNATDANPSSSSTRQRSSVNVHAEEILLLIADKKFCKAIIDASPGTALAAFQTIKDTRNFHINNIKIFAKNIVTEALSNKDSLLYHETDVYETGLIGLDQPFSRTLFSDYEMVETIGTLLGPDNLWGDRKLDASQIEAYSRIVLITFRDYVDQGYIGEYHHPITLYGAMHVIENTVSDLYTLSGVSNNPWDSDIWERLRVVVDFIRNTIGILDKKNIPESLQLRVRESDYKSCYDRIAQMAFKVICFATQVTKPPDLCRQIQYSSVWSRLFIFSGQDSAVAKVVNFKIRRLIYNEIKKMNRFPNFKGASILRFCLNVTGFNLERQSFDDMWALQKVVLSWTKKNFVWLHSYNSNVAEACLPDGVTFEVEKSRLIKTYPAEGLRREPQFDYLELHHNKRM